MKRNAIKAAMKLEEGMMEASDNLVGAKVAMDRAAMKAMPDMIRAKLRASRGVAEAADDFAKAKLLMDRAAFEDLRDKVTSGLEKQSKRAAKAGEMLPSTGELSDWLKRSWDDRPWRPRRRIFRLRFTPLLALLAGATLGMMGMYLIAGKRTRPMLGGKSEMESGMSGMRMSGSGTPMGSRYGAGGSVLEQTGRTDEMLGGAGQRDVPRNEWEQFCEYFTRQHDRWLATIEIEGENGQPQVAVRDQPLIALSFDDSRDKRPDLRVLVGKDPVENLAHVIEDVSRIEVLTGPSETNEGLRMQSSQGTTTVRFRSPSLI